jgi:hypothetical protein
MCRCLENLNFGKVRASTNDKEVDLFNFIDKSPIENLHLSFCKYVLGNESKRLLATFTGKLFNEVVYVQNKVAFVFLTKSVVL